MLSEKFVAVEESEESEVSEVSEESELFNLLL
jgi:hypothetical protein